MTTEPEMTKKDILSGYVDAHIPGHTGWAYDATTWCRDCGESIARRIVRTMTPETLTRVNHDWLCDSDNFPQPISFEDCDYCDECGETTI